MIEEPKITSLSLPPPTGDEEWSELVDRLLEEIPEETPEKVVKATELLLVGFPINEVAKKLSIKPITIRTWIKNYPTMAVILSQGKKLLSKWRMSKMEQQFLTAVERSNEVLTTNLSSREINPKILAAVAAQSRYIIGLFLGQRQDIQVTHELGDTVLNAEQNALNYLAQQLSSQQKNSDLEPIEAVFKVVDDKIDDQGPMLDAHGNPPFGQLGVMDTDSNGTQCKICGEYWKSLAKHLYSKHNVKTQDYELLYMLEEGAVRKADGYWEKN